MRIAITGATGLVGSNFAEIALVAGHSVVCTHRATSRVAHLSHLDIAWRAADLDDPDALALAFEGCDWVVHAAAFVVPGPRASPEMRATNVEGTRRVIEACRRSGVQRLIHVSSVVAIGVTDGAPDATEDAPFDLAERGLLDGYAETKREAEDLVRASVAEGKIDAVIANPTLMFGPYDIKPSTGRFVVDIAHGRLPVAPTGVNNAVDVRDVARGLLLLAERGRKGERYILGGENVTYVELFTRIAKAIGCPPPRWVVPHWIASIGGWIGDARRALGGSPDLDSMAVAWGYNTGFRFSHAKAHRELGYAPGNADEGIRACVEWMRTQKMIPEPTAAL